MARRKRRPHALRGARIAGLDSLSATQRAEAVAFDLVEYLQQVDYNKYFDSMGGAQSGGAMKQFAEFSAQSIRASQVGVWVPCLGGVAHTPLL